MVFVCNSLVFADVKLIRYTDKVSGDEMGVCYSDKDGNPAITNPDWSMEEISEDKKQHYIDLQIKQIISKQKQIDQDHKKNKSDAKKKLKDMGLSEAEINSFIE